ncbi:MAG: uracil-DNA glycosylase family protein [Candidatus Micrarchaeales archaeon]
MRFEYSAGAFVYKVEGEMILLLFLMHDNKKLDMPKGHIEKGESAEVAAIRETKEEAGLNVRLAPYFRENIKYFFYDGKEKVAKQVTLFIAKVSASEKVKISFEHAGFRWLDRKQAIEQSSYKDLEVHINAAFDYIERLEKMDHINKEYSKLPSKYKNWDLSRTFVPGDGPLDAKVMVIGQAPGANEDVLKKPFVGRSGKVLDKMFKIAKLKRETLYITSCVQFFPPKNRGPSKWEIEACREFLMKQIEIIKPERAILLGNFASNTVLGFDKVNQNHGRFVKKDGMEYFITFHPAMALRSSRRVAALMEQDFKSF